MGTHSHATVCCKRGCLNQASALHCCMRALCHTCRPRRERTANASLSVSANTQTFFAFCIVRDSGMQRYSTSRPHSFEADLDLCCINNINMGFSHHADVCRGEFIPIFGFFPSPFSRLRFHFVFFYALIKSNHVPHSTYSNAAFRRKDTQTAHPRNVIIVMIMIIMISDIFDRRTNEDVWRFGAHWVCI